MTLLVWFGVLSDREAGFRRIISAYRSRAKRRGIPWELDNSAAKILLCSACFYCGASGQNFYNRHGLTTDTDYPDLLNANGIDRLDPAGPYSTANCVPACARCNYAKHTQTLPAFLDWLRTVYAHLTTKGRLS